MSGSQAKIMTFWLCGVLAAAQLGKVAALAPALGDRFRLGLPAAGLLISLLEVGGALLGFVAGLLLPAIGARRALRAGLALLAAMTVAEASATAAPLLFVARSLEGLGYLLVVVAAPTMIVAAAAPGRERDGAMVLWSTFVPVGSGLGNIVTGLTAAVFGTSGALLAWAVPAVVLLVWLQRHPVSNPASRRIALPAPAAWLLAVGFGCYTLSLCAVTGLMPIFLHDRQGVGLTAGGIVAGLVALSALPGSFLALAVVRSFADRPARLTRLVCAALVAAFPLAALIFWIDGATAVALIAATVLMLAGLARAVIFSRLPEASGGEGTGDARIAAAQGLLTQFGALGALLGPPLGAATVDRWSWPALGMIVAGGVLLLLLLIAGADRLHRT